jgi:hypothetical protein
MLVLFLAATTAILLVDDIRLRIARGPRSVNVIGSGLVMPTPDDPRWDPDIINVTRTVVDTFGNTQLRTGLEPCLRLGAIAVTTGLIGVFIDNKLQPGFRAWRYGRAVRAAHVQRRALASIEGTS